MNDSLELRMFNEAVEIRSAGSTRTAYGYAAVFDQETRIGNFIERIAPGAFANAIREQDVRALFNHDRNQVLGRMKSGTLRLSEDHHGLAYEIDLPDTAVGRDVAELLRRGDISGSSFGFRVVAGGDTWTTRGAVQVRTVTEVGTLYDVGPVTIPAYDMAAAAVRSLEEAGRLAPPVGRLRMAAEFGSRAAPTVPPRMSWIWA